MDSTPGFPFCRHYKTNAELLGFNGLNVDHSKTQIVVSSFLKWLEDPVEYNFRMFIKDEPHKPSKVDEGRWRLIFSAPLFYQILEHLLLDPLDELEKDNQWSLPTKLGWHPFWGGAQMCRSTFDKPCSMDKKCWDWTLTHYLVELDTQLRKRLVIAPDIWYDLLDKLTSMSFYTASFQFSSGHVFRQTKEGIMKSGLVRTLSTNSHCQYFIHLLACNKCGHNHVCWIIGDDVIVSDPCSEYLEYTSHYCLLKDVDWNYHFAGFDLLKNVPLYWSKHVSRLLYSSDEVIPEILDNYQRLYVYDQSKFNFFQRLLAEYDLSKLRSRDYLLRWSVQKPSNFKFMFKT
ncbi:hypothetical protein 3 [Hubei sobemo-like virus 37]|uniref:hypothetical protein 3 n=1 Tax=Hubei sobemo-like virus 37 TaxID=1923224 RepID=UPI00090BB644|nr:hypothetical protein 3 [Hubei sobemo-like virus 37]APG75782.1 hypothetical protein 3 [Hubei sobemo-like virus 37]